MYPHLKSIAGLILSLVYFGSHVVLGYAAETNIWESRRKSRTENPMFASLSLPAAPKLLSSAIISPVTPSVIQRSENALLANAIESMSSAHGSIQEIYDPSEKGVAPVVLIQDVHLNVEAQKNIAEVMQRLIDSGRIDAIGLEGVFDNLDFSRLRQFKDKKAATFVADAFMKKKYLAAPSYVGITSVAPIPVMIGVDDKTSHESNVQAYRDSLKQQKRVQRILNDSLAAVQSLKQKHYSKPLYSFDQLWNDHEQGRLSWGDYLSKLASMPEIEEASTEITRFLEAYQLEKSLNFGRVDKERQAVLEKLLGALSAAEIQDLIRRSIDYRSRSVSFGAYYRHLASVCKAKSISLEKFPEFNSYIRYVLLSEAVNVNQLFDDIEKRENQIFKSLSGTDVEKQVVQLSRWLDAVQKLVEFKLTPAEWEAYKTVSIDARSFDGIAEKIKKELPVFERFYVEADSRSDVMVKKLLSIPVSETRVLLAGGFHTWAITEALKSKKTPFVVVSPKLTKVEQNGGSDYLSVFEKEKTPIEQLLHGEKLFVNPPTTNVQFQPLNSMVLMETAAHQSEEGAVAGVEVSNREDGVKEVTEGENSILVSGKDAPAENLYEVLSPRVTGDGFYLKENTIRFPARYGKKFVSFLRDFFTLTVHSSNKKSWVAEFGISYISPFLKPVLVTVAMLLFTSLSGYVVDFRYAAVASAALIQIGILSYRSQVGGDELSTTYRKPREYEKNRDVPFARWMRDYSSPRPRSYFIVNSLLMNSSIYLGFYFYMGWQVLAVAVLFSALMRFVYTSFVRLPRASVWNRNVYLLELMADSDQKRDLHRSEFGRFVTGELTHELLQKNYESIFNTRDSYANSAMRLAREFMRRGVNPLEFMKRVASIVPGDVVNNDLPLREALINYTWMSINQNIDPTLDIRSLIQNITHRKLTPRSFHRRLKHLHSMAVFLLQKGFTAEQVDKVLPYIGNVATRLANDDAAFVDIASRLGALAIQLRNEGIEIDGLFKGGLTNMSIIADQNKSVEMFWRLAPEMIRLARVFNGNKQLQSFWEKGPSNLRVLSGGDETAFLDLLSFSEDLIKPERDVQPSHRLAQCIHLVVDRVLKKKAEDPMVSFQQLMLKIKPVVVKVDGVLKESAPVVLAQVIAGIDQGWLAGVNDDDEIKLLVVSLRIHQASSEYRIENLFRWIHGLGPALKKTYADKLESHLEPVLPQSRHGYFEVLRDLPPQFQEMVLSLDVEVARGWQAQPGSIKELGNAYQVFSKSGVGDNFQIGVDAFFMRILSEGMRIYLDELEEFSALLYENKKKILPDQFGAFLLKSSKEKVFDKRILLLRLIGDIWRINNEIENNSLGSESFKKVQKEVQEEIQQVINEVFGKGNVNVGVVRDAKLSILKKVMRVVLPAENGTKREKMNMFEKDPEYLDQGLQLLFLYFKLGSDPTEITDDVKADMATVLEVIFFTGPNDARANKRAVRKMKLESYGHEIDLLVEAQYDRRLLEDGIQIPVGKSRELSNAQKEQDLKRTITQQAEEMIGEIAPKLNYRGDTPKALTTVAEAEAFHAKLKEHSRQMSNPPKGVGNLLQQSEAVIEKLKEIEASSKKDDLASEYVVYIAKRYLDEALIGINQLSGCFAFGGGHQEMPPAHASEGNVFIATLHPVNAKGHVGRNVANVVVALTPEGVVPFQSYPPSSEYEPMWLSAWETLAHLVPRIALKKDMAGWSAANDQNIGSREREFTATKRNRKWGKGAYHDAIGRTLEDYENDGQEGDYRFEFNDDDDVMMLTREDVPNAKKPQFIDWGKDEEKKTKAKKGLLSSDDKAKLAQRLFRAERELELGGLLKAIDTVLVNAESKADVDVIEKLVGEKKGKEITPEQKIEKVQNIVSIINAFKDEFVKASATLTTSKTFAEALLRFPSIGIAGIGLFASVREVFQVFNIPKFFRDHNPRTFADKAILSIGILFIYAAMIAAGAVFLVFNPIGLNLSSLVTVVQFIGVLLGANIGSHAFWNLVVAPLVRPSHHTAQKEILRALRQLKKGEEADREMLARAFSQLAPLENLGLTKAGLKRKQSIEQLIGRLGEEKPADVIPALMLLLAKKVDDKQDSQIDPASFGPTRMRGAVYVLDPGMIAEQVRQKIAHRKPHEKSIYVIDDEEVRAELKASYVGDSSIDFTSNNEAFISSADSLLPGVAAMQIYVSRRVTLSEPVLEWLNNKERTTKIPVEIYLVLFNSLLNDDIVRITSTELRRMWQLRRLIDTQA